jgi:hypothetical protein
VENVEPLVHAAVEYTYSCMSVMRKILERSPVLYWRELVCNEIRRELDTSETEHRPLKPATISYK